MSEISNNNVLSYPTMVRQRAEKIQSKEVAYAEDVNAEFDNIVDVFNQLVLMLTGEWGDGTGRIYELVDNAVTIANEALSKANDCVKKSGDTMTGHLSIALVPSSDYHVVNKMYVEDTIQAELADPVNRITELEKFRDNLKAEQVKLENANFSSTNVHDGMNELFISVSNGKKTVADAITGKGIQTSGDASFKQMADNINAILTFNEGTAGGTATADDIMYGKTAYARGTLLIGKFIPFDTTDATATSSDILAGKTAYVNGKKVYGNLIYTGENIYNPNPDNPYPEKAEVELIYGETNSELKINSIGTLPTNNNGGSNTYDFYDISGDKRLLVLYDSTENKIKTYQRQGDNTYKKEINQNGELRTPEYSLDELGIIDTTDYEVTNIALSPMNAKENASGYECRLAIGMRKQVAKSGIPDYYVYIYKISTFDGKMSLENSLFDAGVEGNTGKFISYNKWLITGTKRTGSKFTGSTSLYWSPYSYSLAVTTAYYDNGWTYGYCDVYTFSDSTAGDQEDYERAVHLKDSINAGTDRVFKNIKFLNNDKIIHTTRYASESYSYKAVIYGNDFSKIKENSVNLCAITNDGLYGIKDNKLFSVTINYDTGNLTVSEIAQTVIASRDDEYWYFSKDNKYLISYGKQYLTPTLIYEMNYETKTAIEIYNKLIDSSELKPIISLKSFAVLEYNRTSYTIDIVANEKDLIGVKYQGETFYKNIFNVGRYTATKNDVKVGKTFIGFNGIPETGTLEV